MDMKTDLMKAIGRVFRRRWTLPILVAATWTAIVTLYVLSGLRPHGYIGDEVEALSTWLGWMVGGGILLVWVMRKNLFDSARIGGLHSRAQASGDEEMEASVQEDADSRDACGLRMGAAGFGYYCGAIRTDND
jgi:hypothetical protein